MKDILKKIGLFILLISLSIGFLFTFWMVGFGCAFGYGEFDFTCDTLWPIYGFVLFFNIISLLCLFVFLFIKKEFFRKTLMIYFITIFLGLLIILTTYTFPKLDKEIQYSIQGKNIDSCEFDSCLVDLFQLDIEKGRDVDLRLCNKLQGGIYKNACFSFYNASTLDQSYCENAGNRSYFPNTYSCYEYVNKK
ncbi:hypothetical protein KY334_07970 [Candidatus Woesearchaeota archaeon]|nr:hypothetical protein [Candidatus Woesearchaeota archaeon]